MSQEDALEALVIAQKQGRVGCITLNRPKALNALSLPMIRDLTQILKAWADDDEVLAVVIRGMSKQEPFGAFCAGGDIRFFHRAALEGDQDLEAFFTEEYALNHLIHRYAKPYIALMDGIVMGGGMGISQGASLRVVTERSKLAMPETGIGLFPDVGGGYFLSRCPQHMGEYLALTGQVIGASEAISVGLADICVDSNRLVKLWDSLAETPFTTGEAVERWVHTYALKDLAKPSWPVSVINSVFGLPDVRAILQRLEADPGQWEQATANLLRKRSPTMLHVVHEQVRRARHMSLAEDLRMERDMVHRCFHLRPGDQSETVEGIRALAIDKDHQPKWNPSRVEDVDPEWVKRFFVSPWSSEAHPLSHLA